MNLRPRQVGDHYPTLRLLRRESNPRRVGYEPTVAPRVAAVAGRGIEPRHRCYSSSSTASGGTHSAHPASGEPPENRTRLRRVAAGVLPRSAAQTERAARVELSTAWKAGRVTNASPASEPPASLELAFRAYLASRAPQRPRCVTVFPGRGTELHPRGDTASRTPILGLPARCSPS